jgi:hypothetical protein
VLLSCVDNLICEARRELSEDNIYMEMRREGGQQHLQQAGHRQLQISCYTIETLEKYSSLKSCLVREF